MRTHRVYRQGRSYLLLLIHLYMYQNHKVYLLPDTTTVTPRQLNNLVLVGGGCNKYFFLRAVSYLIMIYCLQVYLFYVLK